MKKKNLLITIGLTFILALTICLANQGTITAQECRIVRLHSQAEGRPGTMTTIRIEPATLLIGKGGCVIWSNWIKAPEVEVEFEEGKRCVEMTEAATIFELDNVTDCYVATFVSLGGTSSLKFTQEGTYKYKVKAGKGVTEKGKIIVQ